MFQGPSHKIKEMSEMTGNDQILMSVFQSKEKYLEEAESSLSATGLKIFSYS